MEDKYKDVWVRCKGCGHKLFKASNIVFINSNIKDTPMIEIKCHSCKTINNLNFIK